MSDKATNRSSTLSLRDCIEESSTIITSLALFPSSVIFAEHPGLDAAARNVVASKTGPDHSIVAW